MNADVNDNGGLQRSVGRIEGKLDLLLERISTHIADDAVNFEAIGKRLGILEKKVWTMAGVFAAIGAVWTYLVYGVKAAIEQ